MSIPGRFPPSALIPTFPGAPGQTLTSWAWAAIRPAARGGSGCGGLFPHSRLSWNFLGGDWGESLVLSSDKTHSRYYGTWRQTDMIQEENDRERKRIVIDERRRWGKAQKRRGKGDRIQEKEGNRNPESEPESDGGGGWSHGQLSCGALHPCPRTISGGKLTPAWGGGHPEPSLSLNIAWQGDRKGVPGLGCSPLLFPIPSRPRQQRRWLQLFIGGGGGAPPSLGSVHWVPSLTSPPSPFPPPSLSTQHVPPHPRGTLCNSQAPKGWYR